MQEVVNVKQITLLQHHLKPLKVTSVYDVAVV
jgi:hypothetical protein